MKEYRFIAGEFLEENPTASLLRKPPCPVWQVGEGASPSLDDGALMPRTDLLGKTVAA